MRRGDDEGARDRPGRGRALAPAQRRHALLGIRPDDALRGRGNRRAHRLSQDPARPHGASSGQQGRARRRGALARCARGERHGHVPLGHSDQRAGVGRSARPPVRLSARADGAQPRPVPRHGPPGRSRRHRRALRALRPRRRRLRDGVPGRLAGRRHPLALRPRENRS